MMCRTSLFLVALFWGGTASAGEVAITGAEKPIKQYQFAVLTVAVEKGDQVAFQVYPSPEKRDSAGNKLYFSGVPGKKYTVFVTVVNFGPKPDKPETKEFKERFDTGGADVEMEGTAPPLVVPIDPDKPDPEVTALAAALKAAFNAGGTADKAFLPQVTGLYTKYASEQELAPFLTYGALFKAMAESDDGRAVAGKLLGLQTEIAKFLLTKIPGNNSGWQNVALTAEERKKTAAAFKTVKSALETIK